MATGGTMRMPVSCVLSLSFFFVGSQVFGNQTSIKSNAKLKIVANYNGAATEQIWKSKFDLIPNELFGSTPDLNPSMPNDDALPEVFFQEPEFAVCVHDCSLAQPPSAEFDALHSPNQITSMIQKSRASELSLKAANTFYWVKRLFKEMKENLGYTPSKRLIIFVDRQVPHHKSGYRLENNAFFNSADWSLSFLPTRNSTLTWLASIKMQSAEFDPSVIMHEASHSIFEDVLGKIINREVYGLNEAFADYFSLDILNDHRLGLVYGSGKPMRKNDVLLKYKTKMEAHDLGNVVSSALWKSREIINNRKVSLGIAFNTLKRFSKSPYNSLPEIVKIYIDECEKTSLSNEQLSKIQAAWTFVEIPAAESIQIPTPPKLSNLIGGGPFTIFTSENVPSQVALDFGVPLSDTLKIKFLGMSEEILISKNKAKWYVFETTKSGAIANRYSVLYSQTDMRFLAIYKNETLLDGTERTEESGDSLTIAKESLGEISLWLENELYGVIHLTKNTGYLTKTSQLSNRTVRLKINGKIIFATEHRFSVNPSYWSYALRSIMSGAELHLFVPPVKEISIFTVRKNAYPNLDTTSFSEKEISIGFGLTYFTGLQKVTYLEEVDPTQKVLDGSQKIQGSGRDLLVGD